MSTTTQSPKKLAAAAYRIAQDTLPEHRHRYSPKTYRQPQLLVCLVLKVFFKTDYRGIVEILDDWPDLCHVFELKTVPHFTTLQKASKRLLRLATAEPLLDSTIETIQPDRHVALAAMDSTGLDARHVSRYFVSRKRCKELQTRENTSYRRWPQMAILCDCHTHAILSVITTRGPDVDINQFGKILQPAAEKVRIDRLLADAGYDSQANHRFARQAHRIESLIPAKRGRPSPKPFRGQYRRLMQQQFDQEIFGQRWQVETVFSMIKRNQGEALRSKTYGSQNREMILKALTHNLAIILLVSELFYRAYRTPLFPPFEGMGAPIKTIALNW